MTLARIAPNSITPDGVDIETAITNDDTDIKNLYSIVDNVGAISLADTKRQSVLYASTDASGNPNYLTASGLNVSIDGSAIPVILAFAAGFDTKGAVDKVDSISALISNAWTLPSNATSYLYVDKDASTGLLSYGYSSLADLYQKAAPTAVLDQHWYDTVSCKMKRYNGSAWEQKQRVFVGKAVTDATAATLAIYPLKNIEEKVSDKLGRTENAVSATRLATARTINGVSFDGTQPITVYDSTKSAIPTTATGAGQWISATAGGSAYGVPAGGSWVYMLFAFNNPAGTLYTLGSGIIAGGTIIWSGDSTKTAYIIAWRVA